MIEKPAVPTGGLIVPLCPFMRKKIIIRFYFAGIIADQPTIGEKGQPGLIIQKPTTIISRRWGNRMHKPCLFIILTLILVGCVSTGEPQVPTPTTDPTPQAAPPETEPAPEAEDPENAEPSSADPEQLTLHTLPIIPTFSAHAKEIYQAGIAHGRNPQIFTKVGDGMTASENYLFPISRGEYDLGEYQYLKETIDYFSAVTFRETDDEPVDSFSNPSLSVANGFNSANPLDPIWANPNYCQSGEVPVTCELRVSNASLVLIMLGTHDMYFTTDKFQEYLDGIVAETIEAEALPILITFPPRLDKLDLTPIYNEVVLEIGAKYDIPIANLWLALQDLPNYGVAPDEVTTLHLPDDGCTTCFTEENLSAGSVVQNLVAIQALDAARKALSEDQ